MSDQTALQRLLDDEQIKDLINDLQMLEEPSVRNDNDERWEMAVAFGYDDIPYIVGELEEVADDTE